MKPSINFNGVIPLMIIININDDCGLKRTPFKFKKEKRFESNEISLYTKQIVSIERLKAGRSFVVNKKLNRN